MPKFSLGPFLNAEKELWDVKKESVGWRTTSVLPSGPEGNWVAEKFLSGEKFNPTYATAES